MTSASPSALTECAGAVSDANWPVAAHYGNPLREQRDLANGLAIVDLSHRSVLQVTGADRLKWLDSMLSQSLSGLTPGESAEALLLDPHGHVEQAIRILDDGTATWLLIDEQQSESLLNFLNRMIFSADVELHDVTADFATVGWFGTMPAALVDKIFSSAGSPLIWRDPWAITQQGGWQYSPQVTAQSGWNYCEGILQRSKMSDVKKSVDAQQAKLAGLAAWEALRIAAWRPRIVTEGDDKLLPHEVDWLRTAVHLNKGCYRGQETVAKVHNVGHPPRRLVFLDLDGSGEPVVHRGDDVMQDDKKVGTITSFAEHWQEGPIALAVIKRTVDEDAALSIETSTGVVMAQQTTIVPGDAGGIVTIPTELRHRNRE